MTTYNTYQEAKIANPEGDIFTNGSLFTEELMNDLPFVNAWVKCNPAGHCMTVEKFLKDNCKFDDGDTYLDWKGRVRIVGKVGFAKDACNYIRNIANADQAFILRAAALEEKKPRTKVEYVEVTDSIFDLRPDFEAGELFSKVNHARDYSTINNTQTLAQALHQSCCYRRIETLMTEREAFIDEMSRYATPSVLGKMFDSGCRFVSQDSDLLRSRIRAVAEWEMNTSNNHDWESVAESIYCAVDDLLKS